MTDKEHEDQYPQDQEAISTYVYRTIYLGPGKCTIGAPTEEEVQSIAKRLGYEDHQL